MLTFVYYSLIILELLLYFFGRWTEMTFVLLCHAGIFLVAEHHAGRDDQEGLWPGARNEVLDARAARKCCGNAQPRFYYPSDCAFGSG